jgi:transcriptional regulator with XRE-family HTH domain
MEIEGDQERFDLFLQWEMAKRGWDELDLAMESGMSEQAIKAYVRGTQKPTMSSLLLILDALNMRIRFVDK